MIGIGIVGIGFMGMIHYLAAGKAAGARVVALCSRDPKKLAGDWTSIQGNFGPRGSQMDLSGVACYRDFEALLADPKVDLVDLCVPNDAHGRMAIQALQAGKHVLVEKPIALQTAEADAMVAAAAAAGKQLMVGHVLPFFPEFAFALEAVQSGRYGPLARGSSDASDLEARLVQRDRRSRAKWRSGHRSAYPRYALHRPDLRRSARGPLAWSRRQWRGRPPDHAIPLRHPKPGCLLRFRSAEPGRAAVCARLRALFRSGDARIRIRQSGRPRPRGHAALGRLARWNGDPTRAGLRRSRRLVHPGDHGRRRSDRLRARGRAALRQTRPASAATLPGRNREREDTNKWSSSRDVASAKRHASRRAHHEPSGFPVVAVSRRRLLIAVGPRASEPSPHALEFLIVKLARGMGLLERLEQIGRGVRFFHVVNLFPHLIGLHERNHHQHHQNAQAQIIVGGAEVEPSKSGRREQMAHGLIALPHGLTGKFLTP